jgi:exosortase A-associated hydrolase 2
LNVLQEAFFLPVDGGECFCVERRPETAPLKGVIVHLPAFVEEMNKSRSMVARAARAFAARGFCVLQMDLIGCGDSSGDHAQATLTRWTANLFAAIEWLEQKRSANVDWVWAHRGGALLVPAVLGHARCARSSVMLWQPILKGDVQLNQLLRQKAASTLADVGTEGLQVASLRNRLVAGETLEIGGYSISAALAAELAHAKFDLPPMGQRRVVWFELDPSPNPVLSPLARRTVDRLRGADIDVFAASLQGPSFWQSVEIERSDALVDASSAALLSETADAIQRDTVAL